MFGVLTHTKQEDGVRVNLPSLSPCSGCTKLITLLLNSSQITSKNILWSNLGMWLNSKCFCRFLSQTNDSRMLDASMYCYLLGYNPCMFLFILTVAIKRWLLLYINYFTQSYFIYSKPSPQKCNNLYAFLHNNGRWIKYFIATHTSEGNIHKFEYLYLINEFV